MDLCLVAAPTATDYSHPDLFQLQIVQQNCASSPLGILTLAAVVEAAGFQPGVVNLNRLYKDYLCGTGSAEGFLEHATERIAAQPSTVFGFGSICSSYPFTVRLAGEVKRRRPDSVIVLGGPQASVVDLPTLQAFPSVDLILRGEADQSLPVLLEELSGRPRRLDRVAGLTYRTGQRVVRNPNAPPVLDLDQLPLPAFHLDNNLADNESAALEIGRGCPFACTFCSTNDFFRRRFRLKSPGVMIEQMRVVNRRYGHDTFDLTHDLFTVDRRRVEEFCHAMIASGEAFNWACSARTDCIDESLMELMSQAGCKGLFFGIETGSPRMQEIIAKRLDLKHARNMIRAAERFSIRTTVSQIMGYPEESLQDLRQSVEFFFSSLTEPHATPQLNLLAPLADTPICRQYFDRLELYEICSDVSRQGRLEDPIEHLMIAAHPEIFPNFYLLPTSHLDRPTLLELEILFEMARQSVRSLLLALHRAFPDGAVLDVLLDWIGERQRLHPEVVTRTVRNYYGQAQFRWEFGDFIRSRNVAWGDPAVAALCDCEEFAKRWRNETSEIIERRRSSRRPSDPGEYPVLCANVHVCDLDWDLTAVLEFLKTGRTEQELHRQSSYITQPGADGHWSFTKIPTAMADLVKWCDGGHSLPGIMARFRESYGNWHGFDASTICATVVGQYVEQGILRIERNVSRDLSIQDGRHSNSE